MYKFQTKFVLPKYIAHNDVRVAATNFYFITSFTIGELQQTKSKSTIATSI